MSLDFLMTNYWWVCQKTEIKSTYGISAQVEIDESEFKNFNTFYLYAGEKYREEKIMNYIAQLQQERLTGETCLCFY